MAKVNMPEYPDNSQVKTHYDKEPQEVTEKPSVKLEGGITRKKKSVWKRMCETFAPEERIDVAGEVFNIVSDSIKDMAYNALTAALEGALFGGAGSGYYSRPLNKGRRNKYGSRTDYAGISRDNRPSVTLSRRARRALDFDEFEFDSMKDAKKVLDIMRWHINEYSYIRVADFYDILSDVLEDEGITPDYTDRKWGWYDLSEARVMAVRGRKYIIDFPKPEQIDE